MPTDPKSTSNPQSLLRELPSVDSVLANDEIKSVSQGLSPELVTDLVRESIDAIRRHITKFTKAKGHGATADSLNKAVISRSIAAIAALRAPNITRVINATGIIIHTGMGRSPIPKGALAAVAETAAGYCDIDVDKRDGGRRGRHKVVEELLQRLTGCEAALITNNNAAATLLALHTLACDKEVIVSRGQLVEIGGNFRLPDVMTSAGATLDEVGTTNRTRIADYESAINENTAALMRIHPSNFRIVGFTESVEIAPLVALGRERGIKVIDDIGSGALIDLAPWGLKDEPLVRESVEAGSDVVLFSGDKLVGGPQAGILVGKRESIEACAKNPLMRALRVGKMTLAALEYILMIYLEPARIAQEIPIMKAIQEPVETVRARAAQLADHLAAALKKRSEETSTDLSITVEEDVAYVGGGSLPEESLPSWIVALDLHGQLPSGASLDAIKRRLRTSTPSVFARTRQDRLEFDMRTVADSDLEALASVILTSASIEA